MTTPTLIYIGFSGLTGLMCLWALASARFGGHEHRGLHRIVVFATALGLLAATGAAAFGPGTGHPRGVWATGLLPLLTLAATWSNLAALRGSGVLLKFVTLPILIYNLLHLGIYTVWSIHELAGWDTGTWGSAMLGADTHVQRLCGHPNAADDPRWLRLPILLPLGAAASITAVGSTLLTSLASGLTVALFAIVMPHAFLRTRSYHDAPQADLQALPKVGFKVPWATRVLSETERLRIRSHLLRLGATSVTFEVRDAMFGNQAVVDQARGEVQWAKAQGLQTIAIAQPPHRFEAIPAVSLDELRGGMAQTHWMTAEKLQVDLLVLFSGPLTRMAAMIGGSTSIDDWYTQIKKCAAQARQANPAVRLSVSLHRWDRRSDELFRRLKDSQSPVDVVGLSVFPDERMLDEVERDLLNLQRWTERTPGRKPCMVVECCCPPQINGGERGQWNLLSRVLKLAAQTPSLEAVCLDSLYDDRHGFGLINRAGRRRTSYRELMQIAVPRTAKDASPPGKPAK